MSRLEDALVAHEELLRRELATAERKRADLRQELLKIQKTIREARVDLGEVETELRKRGVSREPSAPPPKDFTIAEEF